MRELLLDELRITADLEFPMPMLAGVVDGGDPAPCRIVLGARLPVLEALDFKDDVHTRGQSNDEVGFVGMINALILVGDDQTEVVVAGIAVDRLAALQPEGDACRSRRSQAVREHSFATSSRN